ETARLLKTDRVARDAVAVPGPLGFLQRQPRARVPEFPLGVRMPRRLFVLRRALRVGVDRLFPEVVFALVALLARLGADKRRAARRRGRARHVGFALAVQLAERCFVRREALVERGIARHAARERQRLKTEAAACG